MKLLKTTKHKYMFTIGTLLRHQSDYWYCFRTATNGWEFEYEIS